MDAVFASRGPLVAFAVRIVAIRIEHLEFEMGRENATRSHFGGVARMQLGCGGAVGAGRRRLGMVEGSCWMTEMML